jgi:hypothetical protein
VIALLHLTGYGEGLGVSKLYAVGTAVLWSCIVLWLLWLYATERARAALIPLFWDDLFVSSGVVVFAFVGTMVYVAYSMHEKDARFAEWSQNKKRQVLLTLGGRVLVGPYVAVVAYGIMATTFPVLNTGAAAAFFGFFTGLWIKPVLEALNDIGLRLLSAESRQKVVDRLTNQDFADFTKETSSADYVRAERAFLRAVAIAREELLQKDNVIGVGTGEKLVQGLGTGRKAIVVYVYSKRRLPEHDTNRVPPSINGFPTDVQIVPPAPADDRCHRTMLDISPEKIYADQRARGLASTVSVGTDAAVPYLVDPSKTLFFGPEDADGKTFVIRSAYEAVRSRIGDKFDFVAFVLDRGMSEGYYYRPIFNDARGIDFYWEQDSPKPFDKREEWDVINLRGVLVLPQRLNVKTCLHELGHAWSSYIRFRAPKTLRSAAPRYVRLRPASTLAAIVAGPRGRVRAIGAELFDVLTKVAGLNIPNGVAGLAAGGDCKNPAVVEFKRTLSEAGQLLDSTKASLADRAAAAKEVTAFIEFTSKDPIDCVEACKRARTVRPKIDVLTDLDALKKDVDNLEKKITAAEAQLTTANSVIAAMPATNDQEKDEREACAEALTGSAKKIDDLKNAATSLKEGMKQLDGAQASAKVLAKAIDDSSDPNAFVQVVNSPGTDSRHTLTIVGTSLLETKEQKVTIVVDVGSTRVAVSGGVGFSTIEDVTIVRQKALDPATNNLVEVFAEENSSSFKPNPIMMLSTNIGNEFPFLGISSAPALFSWSLGIVLASRNDTTQTEYITGPSIGFLDNHVIFTLGYHAARVKSLGGNFKVGDPIPADLADPLPVTQKWDGGFMFGVTYRFR